MASLRAPCVRAPQAILAERRSRARAGMARGAPPSTHACGIFQQATASGHPREDCDSPWLPTRPFCTLQSTWFARQEPSVRCRSPLQTARTSRASCRSPLRSGQWPSAWCSSPLFSAHSRRASRKRPLRAWQWPSAPCNRACFFSNAPSAPCTRPVCAKPACAHRTGRARRVLHLPCQSCQPPHCPANPASDPPPRCPRHATRLPCTAHKGI